MHSRWHCLVLAAAAAALCAAQELRPLPSPDPKLVASYDLALEAVFSMGIRLQAVFQDEKSDNFLISPLSAVFVIGQLMLGSEGQFQKDLADLLNLPDTQSHATNQIVYYGKGNATEPLPYSRLHLQLSSLMKALTSTKSQQQFILTQHNGAFISKSVRLQRKFTRDLRNLYDVNIQRLDFENQPLEAQKAVNYWASKHTNGLITEILPVPPPPETTAIFANAIYFKSDWEIPFSDILNRNGSFQVDEGREVNVTYMIGMMESILYAETKEYRVIALPYKNEELDMYIILPNADHQHKYNIRLFIQNLKAAVVLDAITNAQRRDVIVKLPKMSLTDRISILKELRKYQAYKAQGLDKTSVNSSGPIDALKDKVNIFENFTASMESDIYLTKAASQPLRVDDIVQEIFVTVNEKGTEAAAISASTIDYIGGQKNFLVERPFCFFIRHEATSAGLFWGSVQNPS